MEKSKDINKKDDNLMQNLVDKKEKEEDANIIKNPPSSLNSYESGEYTIEILSSNHTQYDKSIKVILIGDSNVGKTSILNCLEEKNIIDKKTISLDNFNYNIKINNYVIRMQIWDTVGQEKFNSITANYYKTTDVAIFVYAINDINSFNNIKVWLDELNDKKVSVNNSVEEICEKMMVKILVGNKKDLINERKVTYEMGEKLKKDKNFNLFKEISCNVSNKNEAILEENNSNNSEENTNVNNLNIEKMDINNAENKESVKNLFKEIVKIVYKENIEDQGGRQNSSIYYYEASNSILEITPEKSDSESDRKLMEMYDNPHRSCCFK